jgi:hypothetical protein
LRHDGGKDDRGVDLVLRQRLVNPRLQASVLVVAQTQRLVREQTTQATQLGAARVQAGNVHVRADLAHGVDIGFVGRVVNKGAQKHAVLFDQMLEQVVGADFVALVRRIRQPVNEVKQVAHGAV